MQNKLANAGVLAYFLVPVICVYLLIVAGMGFSLKDGVLVPALIIGFLATLSGLSATCRFKYSFPIGVVSAVLALIVVLTTRPGEEQLMGLDPELQSYIVWKTKKALMPLFFLLSGGVVLTFLTSSLFQNEVSELSGRSFVEGLDGLVVPGKRNEVMTSVLLLGLAGALGLMGLVGKLALGLAGAGSLGLLMCARPQE